MSWTVVILKPNQSNKAEKNLVNQGIPTFFPKITYRLKDKLISKDLFPGYAFIQLTNLEYIRSINSTKGVSKILRINDLVPQVADSLIKKIKKQIINFNSMPFYQKSFEKNDRVLVKLKIYNNQEAEVLKVLNKQNSQKVLLKILNSDHTFWVQGKNLEHA